MQCPALEERGEVSLRVLGEVHLALLAHQELAPDNHTHPPC